MTPQEAIKHLRSYIGERGQHHHNCRTRLEKPSLWERCDCYAKGRELAHLCLDVVERGLKSCN